MPIDLTLASAVFEGSSGTTTLNVPAGTVDGDMLIAVIYVQSNADDHVSNNGFTLIGNDPNVTYGSARMTAWWKRASGEGATVTWSHTNTTTGNAILRVKGVLKAGNPLDSAVTLNSLELSTAISCPSITTLHDNSAVFMVTSRVQPATYSAETLTRRVIQQGGNGDASIFADIQAAAGASGAHTVTVAAANGYNQGIMFSLRAAGAGIRWGEVT